MCLLNLPSASTSLVISLFQGVRLDDPKEANVSGYSWEVVHLGKTYFIDGADEKEG